MEAFTTFSYTHSEAAAQVFDEPKRTICLTICQTKLNLINPGTGYDTQTKDSQNPISVRSMGMKGWHQQLIRFCKTYLETNSSGDTVDQTKIMMGGAQGDDITSPTLSLPCLKRSSDDNPQKGSPMNRNLFRRELFTSNVTDGENAWNNIAGLHVHRQKWGERAKSEC